MTWAEGMSIVGVQIKMRELRIARRNVTRMLDVKVIRSGPQTLDVTFTQHLLAIQSAPKEMRVILET